MNMLNTLPDKDDNVIELQDDKAQQVTKIKFSSDNKRQISRLFLKICIIFLSIATLVLIFITLNLNYTNSQKLKFYFESQPIDIRDENVVKYLSINVANEFPLHTNCTAIHYSDNVNVLHLMDQGKEPDKRCTVTVDKFWLFDYEQVKLEKLYFVADRRVNGSDHSINGQIYAAEMQALFKRKNDKNSFYKLCILIQASNETSALPFYDASMKNVDLEILRKDMQHYLNEIYVYESYNKKKNLKLFNIVSKQVLRMTESEIEKIRNIKYRRPLKKTENKNVKYYDFTVKTPKKDEPKIPKVEPIEKKEKDPENVNKT